MNRNALPIIIFLVVSISVIVLWTYNRSKDPLYTNYPSKGTDTIAFGDSLVSGFGSTQGNDFVSLLSQKIHEPIINVGKSGDTTKQARDRLAALDSYHPKVVIVLLGGNDFLQKVPGDQTYANLAFIIENVQKRGAVVLLLGIRSGLIGDPFDRQFEKLKDAYHTAYVPDVLLGLFGDSQYMSDSVHPNDRGYAQIAARVYPTLESLLQ